MNVAQLMHRQCISSIPHCPAFVIYPEYKHYWYFYSADQRTLRKKSMNTSIKSYLSSPNNNHKFLVIKQIDWDKPHRAGCSQVQVTTIASSAIIGLINKTGKSKSSNDHPKDDQIIFSNQWKPNDSEKVTILKLQDNQQWTVNSLLWSLNIVQCSTTISGFIQNKLTEYCLAMKKIIQQQIFNNSDLDGSKEVKSREVIELQLIFRYKQNEGLIQLLFIQKIKLRNTETLFYMTNFKAGQDQYERIELVAKQLQSNYHKLQNELQNIEESESSQKQSEYQLKKMRYLTILRKLAQQPLNNIKKNSEKSRQIIKQYSCSACRNLVVIYSQPLQQNQRCQEQHQDLVERLVSSNRIPEIQIARQIRIHKTSKENTYELVPVCEVCYQKFVQFVQENSNNRLRIDSQRSRRAYGTSQNSRVKCQILSLDKQSIKRSSNRQKQIHRQKFQSALLQSKHQRSKKEKSIAQLSSDGAILYNNNKNNRMSMITTTTINQYLKRPSLAPKSAQGRQTKIVSMANYFRGRNQSEFQKQKLNFPVNTSHEESRQHQEIQSDNFFKQNQSHENRLKIGSMQLADALKEYERPNFNPLSNMNPFPKHKGNSRISYKFARKCQYSRSFIVN